MFLLDTNTLSYFLRGEGRIAERLFALRPTEVALPAPVLHEIEFGMLRAGITGIRRRRMDAALHAFTVSPLDTAAAIASAKLRAAAERSGTPIGPFDTLIAGIAIATNATLVTHNVREFSRVSGLKVVDWYD